jgi:hypothetical protein
MKTDIIKKRQRYESNNTTNVKGKNGKKLKGDKEEEEEDVLLSPPLFQQSNDVFGFNPQHPQQHFTGGFQHPIADPTNMDEMMPNNYY